MAWHVRNNLKLDYLSGVVVASAGDTQHPDNIIFDIKTTTNGGLLNPNGMLSTSGSGYGHPDCGGGLDPKTLPPVE